MTLFIRRDDPMHTPIRLSKRLIELIGCSRREAELYIEGGWVTVNGVIVEAPQQPVTDETVALLPGAQALTPEPVTLLFNKPAGLSTEDLARHLTQANHWADDPSGIRVLKGHFARLQESLPIARQTAGLVILSQDWRTARKLQSDAQKLEHEYLISAQGSLSEAQVDRAKRGLHNQGQIFPPCKLSWQNEETLRLAVKNPCISFIPELCQALKLTLGEHRRLRVGGVSMGKLPIGQWRYLRANERF